VSCHRADRSREPAERRSRESGSHAPRSGAAGHRLCHCWESRPHFGHPGRFGPRCQPFGRRCHPERSEGSARGSLEG